MKIIELRAENVKKLKSIQIEPDGNVVVIGGQNGAGKSSVLDSIAYALGGKALIPAEPIRRGEEHASITADVGDYTIERTFTENGSALRITDAQGFRASSPQKLLNGLFNQHSADPLAFANAAPGKQAETLRNLVGLDTSRIDEEHRQLYDERTQRGREVKHLKGAYESAEMFEDAPAEEVSVEELLVELDKRIARNTERDYNLGILETLNQKHARLLAEISVLQDEIGDCRKDIAAIEPRIIKGKEYRASTPLADTSEIKAQISAADDINKRVRANLLHDERGREYASADLEYKNITTEIEANREAKRVMISKAVFPVGGLGFDDRGMTFNDLPFDQASQAERLRVSVAMALATNPKLRVVLIRDGSLLDEDNLRMIAEMAEAADAQVWIERVGDGPDVSVLIVDGEIEGGN